MTPQQQKPSEKLVSFPFSWDNQRRNLAAGLISLICGFGCAYCMQYLSIGNTAVRMLIMGIGYFGFYQYAEFLLTPGLLEKHIVAWEEMAAKKLQEKANAEARLKLLKSLALNAEDQEDALLPFKDVMAADEAFMENTHDLLSVSSEQLKTFKEVMRRKMLLGRIFAMLMSDIYWFARLPMDVTNID